MLFYPHGLRSTEGRLGVYRVRVSNLVPSRNAHEHVRPENDKGMRLLNNIR